MSLEIVNRLMRHKNKIFYHICSFTLNQERGKSDGSLNVEDSKTCCYKPLDEISKWAGKAELQSLKEHVRIRTSQHTFINTKIQYDPDISQRRRQLFASFFR